MKKKLNLKVLFVITILWLSILFTSIIIFINQRPVYDSTHAEIKYDFIINESQYQDMCDTLQNISYQSYFNRFEIDAGEFFFFHRDKFNKIDERYTIRGTLWVKDKLTIPLNMKAYKSEEDDKELMKSNIDFIKNILFPILGEPSKITCVPMIPSG
jgi:hypothetical protein